MPPDELEVAGEAFFTGTADEVTAAGLVDRKRVGNGPGGPLTTELKQAFFAAMSGNDQEHKGWRQASHNSTQQERARAVSAPAGTSNAKQGLAP